MVDNQQNILKELVEKQKQKQFEKKLFEKVQREDLQQWAKGGIGFQQYFNQENKEEVEKWRKWDWSRLGRE